MTIQVHEGVIPQFTMGDRLRKARELADLDQARFAAEIGVSRGTVKNYEHEHVTPRRPVLVAWAFRTGVPLTWLETGAENPRQDGPDGGSTLVRPEGFEPPTFWFGAERRHARRRRELVAA